LVLRVSGDRRGEDPASPRQPIIASGGRCRRRRQDLLVVASPDGVEVDRVPAPKPLVFAQAKLRAPKRRAARQYGPYDPASRARRDPSKRWRRTRARITQTHARVAQVRANELHAATSALATRHEVVVVEQLNAKGLSRRRGLRKRGLNRALGDAALGRMRTHLEYKTRWYGAQLLTASRFFPSSQLCSRCRAKTKLSLPTNHGREMGTGTGSSPAANQRVGDGRGAIQKTGPTCREGMAGGDEASTPHTTKTGTATPQGEGA
jgi:putative transposase